MSGSYTDTLLVIPCCGDKKGTGPILPAPHRPIADFLSESTGALLRECRQLAFSKRGVSLDLDSPLLPAITWYTGMPYRLGGFHEAVAAARAEGIHCLVVSGGYGLLRIDEPIHHYNAPMGRTCAIWKRCLPAIVSDYVQRNGIRRVFVGASSKYREALNPNSWTCRAATWWLVPHFDRRVQSGSALTEVPKMVGQGVIRLLSSGLAPNNAWSSGPPTPRHQASSLHRTTSLVPVSEPAPSVPRPGSKEAAIPTTKDFELALSQLLREGERAGLPYVELDARSVHQRVGGYPGPNHRMPVCCRVMRGNMKLGDQILTEPPSGQGASLKIRFCLPR